MQLQAFALEPVQPGSWRTAGTEHFRFHYLPGDEPVVRRLLGMAENVHDWVTKQASWDPGVVDVTVISYVDQTNGLTTALPSSQMRLYVLPPRGDSSLVSYRDWLEMLFLHEYVHAVHLDIAHGPSLWLRYILGRTVLSGISVEFGDRTGFGQGLVVPAVPFISTVPNVLLQPWITEGLATVAESWATGRGRLYSAWGRMVVREAIRSRTLPNWSDMADNDFIPWPWGTSWYLFGASLYRWMDQEQGRDSVWKWQHHNAWGFAPFLPWLSFATATGHSLNHAWSESAKSLRDTWNRHNPSPVQVIQKLDGAGLTRLPVTGKQGIYWLQADGDHPTQIRFWDGDENHKVIAARGTERFSVQEPWILLDRLHYKDEYNLIKQLALYNLDTGKLRSVADSDRMGDPELGPDGMVLAVLFSTRGSALAKGTMSSGGQIKWEKNPLFNVADGSLQSPKISPDGKQVAYVRHSETTGHDIWLYNLASKKHKRLTRGLAEELFPVWYTADTLRYTSSRGGFFNLYDLNLGSGESTRRTDTWSGWFESSAPYKGNSAAVRYEDGGYSVYLLPGELPTYQELAEEPRHKAEMSYAKPVSKITSASYRPWLSLLPRYWTPLFLVNLQTGTLVRGVGAETGGVDVLGHHKWNLSLYSSVEEWRPALAVSYGYHGLPAHLSFAASHDYTDISYFSEDGTSPFHIPVRLTELRQAASASATFVHPGFRSRWQFSVGASISRQLPEDGFIIEGAPPYGVQAGPFVQASWSDYTGSHYVPGVHEGFGASTTLQLNRTAPVFQENGVVAGGLLSLYAGKHLFWHNLASLQLYLGYAGGDLMRNRFFSLITPESQTGADGMFRIEQRNRPVSVNGRILAGARGELSQPLWFIQTGARWLPLLIKRLDLILFANVMSVANEWNELRPQSYTGAELQFQSILAQIVPISVGFGVTVSLHDPHEISYFLRPLLRF